MTLPELSRRERQIMDAIYKLGKATVAEVLDEITDPPSYSAVRALIGILEEKGHLRHVRAGRHYVYMPVVKREKARKNALKHMVHTFFDGSAHEVVAALLDMKKDELSDEDLQRLTEMIDKAAKGGM